MHMWLFTNAIDIVSCIHGRIRIWVCCYAPDFRTGTFIAVIRRCREVFSRWECGFHWKLCYCWLEGLRRRRVAVIMQGQGIRAHLFIYIYYHMRCMGSRFNMLLMISANVFFCSFKQCIVSNILLRFCWDYTGRSALGQVETCHQKVTRHHLKQCRTTDAYMRHRASVG